MRYLTNFRPEALPAVKAALRDMQGTENAYFLVYPHPMPPEFGFSMYNYDKAAAEGYYSIATFDHTSKDILDKFWRLYAERRNNLDRYTR